MRIPWELPMRTMRVFMAKALVCLQCSYSGGTWQPELSHVALLPVRRRFLLDLLDEGLEDRRVRQVRADAPSMWAACRQRRRRGTVRHRRLDAPYPPPDGHQPQCLRTLPDFPEFAQSV